MTKFFSAAAVALLLGITAAAARPADTATGDHAATAAPATTQGTRPTDLSAARRHYRYVRNRWRVAQPVPVQAYPSYGYYGPRPHLYRPYPYYMPLPFGFGFGFDPYYW